MDTYLLIAVSAVLMVSTIAFLVSLVLKDASIADVFWGIYFVAIACFLLFIAENPSKIQIIDTVLVSIWGLRLSWHVGKRKIGKPEDFRYTKYRKEWGSSFAVKSYLNHFAFQGVLALLISASTIVAAQAGSMHANIDLWQWLGVLIWIVGFGFEAISDRQLGNFIKNRTSKNEIMSSGLWKYSRHPNYFGEIIQWWGLWILVSSLPKGVWAIVSPVTITIFILFVSGVPLLEKRYKDNKNYQQYAKRTSILVPLPNKKEV